MTIYEGFIGFKFVYALGWTIVHSLWQCGVIGLILAIFLFLGGKLNSNTRCWFSFAALLLCVTASAITFVTFFRNIAEVHLTVGEGALEPGLLFVIQANTGEAFAGISHFIEQNITAVVVLWTIGCLGYFIRYLFEYYYCHQTRFRG